MTKIITSESDVELDPESLTASTIDTGLAFDNVKRLEAIRELEKLIDDSESVNVSKQKQESNSIKCLIKFRTRTSNAHYVVNAELSGLNQTIVERNSSELELIGDDKKLIKLFSYYQNNVYKQKRVKKVSGPLKMILQSKRTSKRRRKLYTKNDVFVEELSAKIKGKRFNLIELGNLTWKVAEMKYTFDNNRSTVRLLLIRSK